MAARAYIGTVIAHMKREKYIVHLDYMCTCHWRHRSSHAPVHVPDFHVTVRYRRNQGAQEARNQKKNWA